MTTTNQVQSTIIDQACACGVRAREVVLLDESTVRFHKRLAKGYRSLNMDVRYDEALDLYEVTRHLTTMDRDTYALATDSETFHMVYGDQLAAFWGDRS